MSGQPDALRAPPEALLAEMEWADTNRRIDQPCCLFCGRLKSEGHNSVCRFAALAALLSAERSPASPDPDTEKRAALTAAVQALDRRAADPSIEVSSLEWSILRSNIVSAARALVTPQDLT